MLDFFKNMLGINCGLSKLEVLILDTVRNNIDPSMINLWDRQLQAINKIQRLPGGVEVNFYRMKNGKPNFDGNIAFPNKSDEYEIAKVYLRIENSSIENVASVWCVKGLIFSIEYTSCADYFEEVIAMDPMPEISIKCILNQ
ncbi:hypothetical protein [Methylomonas sp. ZR1]|uniref:hypothetical protein n=1 Tax=Methylomonas sp. ZR1 TaxID=1797072 RepID=UPI0014920E4A|nr:hypothetical protein [Methylomonas sp. ZR1]